MNDLSCRLRTLRQERGWSQERLAAETDLSHRTITRLERAGNTTTPTRSTLRLIASAFGVKISDLTR